MAVIKARPDAIQSPAPAVSIIKSIQRGTVTMSSGNSTNVTISAVNPAKSTVRLQYKNNIGAYSKNGTDTSKGQTAAFEAVAGFINAGAELNIAMTDQFVVDSVYNGSGYTDSYISKNNILVSWEVIEYV